MRRRLLVSVAELSALLERDACRVFDCRFNLGDPTEGRRAWLEGHVPGAAHADLDHDLAGPVTPDSGRHPLPHTDRFAAFLAHSGWREGLPIVAYDAQGGAFAARLWWLMRWFGHDCVSLLDGGWSAWRAAGGEMAVGEERFEEQPTPHLVPDPAMILDADSVVVGLNRGDITLLDARDADRFAGRNETIDPVAGHVPGARNRPFKANLGANGFFRARDELADGFSEALGKQDPESVVHMCGSGVTACHNQLAMMLAGLPSGRLYPGSWSEWIRDEDRPVAGSGD